MIVSRCLANPGDISERAYRKIKGIPFKARQGVALGYFPDLPRAMKTLTFKGLGDRQARRAARRAERRTARVHIAEQVD